MTLILDTTLRRKPSTTTEKGLGRARDILLAARALLASEGYAGLSMRRVAQDAGMSLSNVQHYYGSKEQLLEALLLTIMDEFQAKMDRIAVAMAGRPQVERFLSTVDMFLDEITDPTMHAIFFEIWALASRHPFASNLMARMMARERRAVYGLIRGLNPAIDDEAAMERAVLVAAQIQGLMLFRLDRHARPEQYASVRASLHNVLLSLATVP
ncbi:TetR/AcrR family transcriptional regulator [Massilia sp. IC2-477]|uniref:TetR/AcrR family transcriptional regulator n=1 Tax=unclassified Massilia TaxID=2609279 RepID=UPI001D0F768D|nr:MULTISPECIES: TetR/AcrR family transcriptional regulator [unclassified Massilia]MCC2956651.1 TetR/AcrR family transcriptional regulator [Massilia sp. IC2-477]MCC2971230.1 TetR/AcrR family transcriptional regulator [Massilia sp. IC2-476]